MQHRALLVHLILIPYVRKNPSIKTQFNVKIMSCKETDNGVEHLA